MVEAGARATDQAPLAWLPMEADHTDQDGAEVSLIVMPSGVKFDLWRADFHCRWVRWVPPICPPPNWARDIVPDTALGASLAMTGH